MLFDKIVFHILFHLHKQVRTYDGAILSVGYPFPGSQHDIHDFPDDDIPRLTDKGYVGRLAAIHPIKKRPIHTLTMREKEYNKFVRKGRALDEPVHGRLKTQFPRLSFWTARADDCDLLHAAWLFAAVYHNIYIAQRPLICAGRQWSWLLGRGVSLPSSDVWPGSAHLVVRNTGITFIHGMLLFQNLSLIFLRRGTANLFFFVIAA